MDTFVPRFMLNVGFARIPNWFDLKRTGTIDAVIGSLKPTWNDDYRLAPIPQLEIAADPNLTQNPGY